MRRVVVFVAMLALVGCKSRQTEVRTERTDTLAASYREALMVELEDVEIGRGQEVRCRGDSVAGPVRVARMRVVRGRAAEVEARAEESASRAEQTGAAAQSGARRFFWWGVFMAVALLGAISGALSRSRQR